MPTGGACCICSPWLGLGLASGSSNAGSQTLNLLGNYWAVTSGVLSKVKGGFPHLSQGGLVFTAVSLPCSCSSLQQSLTVTPSDGVGVCSGADWTAGHRPALQLLYWA